MRYIEYIESPAPLVVIWTSPCIRYTFFLCAACDDLTFILKVHTLTVHCRLLSLDKLCDHICTRSSLDVVPLLCSIDLQASRNHLQSRRLLSCRTGWPRRPPESYDILLRDVNPLSFALGISAASCATYLRMASQLLRGKSSMRWSTWWRTCATVASAHATACRRMRIEQGIPRVCGGNMGCQTGRTR